MQELNGHQAVTEPRAGGQRGEHGRPNAWHFTPCLSRPTVGMDTITRQVQFQNEWAPFYTWLPITYDPQVSIYRPLR